MSQINYAAMSNQELRKYFLKHREDKMALQAYLDRLSDRQRNIITTVDDPDFDAIQAAIRQHVTFIIDTLKDVATPTKPACAGLRFVACAGRLPFGTRPDRSTSPTLRLVWVGVGSNKSFLKMWLRL